MVPRQIDSVRGSRRPGQGIMVARRRPHLTEEFTLSCHKLSVIKESSTLIAHSNNNNSVPGGLGA